MERSLLIEKITQWLDGELSAAEIKAFQKYLADHPDHLETYQAIRRADHLLRRAAGVMAAPEPDFAARFETRLAGYQPGQVWRTGVGLGVLLLSAAALLALVAVAGGLTLLNTWAALIDMSLLYYWLGMLGETVDQARAVLNLAGVFITIALIAVSQPAFWLLILLAAGLTWLWIRLIKTPRQRLPDTMNLVV